MRLVIQAVMEGQGIALGWRHLAERLLASGLLVRGDQSYAEDRQGFYVIWPRNRELTDNARKVSDWLAAQACSKRSAWPMRCRVVEKSTTRDQTEPSFFRPSTSILSIVGGPTNNVSALAISALAISPVKMRSRPASS